MTNWPWNIRFPQPRRRDWRIGCIGAGFIMRDCHLPAYQQAGWQPTVIASRSRTTAEQVAALRNIPRVAPSVEALLADRSLEILDIAVPPQHQPGIIRQAVEFGCGSLRGILAQKPLALSVAEGRDLVQRCEHAGITLAVNQNMRYDPSVRSLRAALDQGLLGEPILATIDMRAVPHWMPWAAELPSLSTFVMSIHHLDTFRYWLGTPDRVLASTRPDPRTQFPHRDGINLYILEYAQGTRAAAWDDVWAGPDTGRTAAPESFRSIHWRVEGTVGIAIGSIGWPGYPARVPSTMTIHSQLLTPGWHMTGSDEVWFPDAFAGPMAELLVGIEEGVEPRHSGRDNLETLALCTAVFTAATEHRPTTVHEFLS